MRRFPAHFVAVLVLGFSSLVFSQGAPGAVQGGRPGATVPGAPTPGVPRPAPPRDGPGAPAPTGTAKVRGRVLAQDGTPLRRAQIALSSTEGTQLRRVTTTDGEGRYEITELPAGRFGITATKAGYVTLQYGQRRPYEAGTPVSVADGQPVSSIDFALPRGSVIAVRVADEFGEPIAGAQVQVQRFQYGPDGQRRLTTAQSGVSGLSGTDDRGELRVFGLMPGEYVLMANVRNVIGPAGGGNANDANEGFAATYYPGTTTSADAQPVSVTVGQELAVQLAMVPSRMGRVTGRVVDSEGRPAGGAQLSVITVSGNGMSSYGAGQAAADGSFTLSGISPGEHTLRVQSRAGGAGEFASVPLVVGSADITGLQVTTGPGATITGRVVFDGTAPRTGAPVAPRVTAQQVDPQRALAMIGGTTDPLANGALDDDGNFKLAGVGGRVFFTVPAPPGWTLKSVSLGGDDITDVPMDMAGKTTLSDMQIVLTDKLTNIAGQVLDARGQALKDYVVVIQSAEQKEPVIASRWLRVVRPDNTGRFQTRGMRPGRYVATAIESLEQGRQFAPEFQRELRRGAQEFSVREGESVTVDLKLAPDL